MQLYVRSSALRCDPRCSQGGAWRRRLHRPGARRGDEPLPEFAPCRARFAERHERSKPDGVIEYKRLVVGGHGNDAADALVSVAPPTRPILKRSRYALRDRVLSRSANPSISSKVSLVAPSF